MRSCIVSGIFIGLMMSGALAQESEQPDKTGTHESVGGVCSWSSFDRGRSLTMKYGQFNGQIEIRDRLDAGLTTPFQLRMEHPDGAVTTTAETDALRAVDRLCGLMVVAQDQRRKAQGYSPDAAYRDLLAALSEDERPETERARDR